METLWTQIQSRMREILSEAEYSVWVASLNGEVRRKNEIPHIVLFARNAHIAKYLRKYSIYFQEAAAKVLGMENSALIDIEFEVLKNNTQVIKGFSAEEVAKSLETAPSLLATGNSVSQLLLPMQFAQEKPVDFKYSFDDFIVGASNKLALAAAENIIEQNSITNMLFLSSRSGLGKTHLAQAIGTAMQQKKGKMPKVAYLTAENFTSQFIRASLSKDFESFKQRFSLCDMLLLEDVHFFHGKDKTQEMVLNIIKSIHARGGKVVLTSSFAPKDIVGLDSYLASQFQSGFVASIERPDMETRFQILVEKSKKFGLALPENIAELMAKRIDADVRMLESCLHNVMIRAKVMDSTVTEDIVYDVISQVSHSQPTLDLPSIVDMVCQGFGVTKSQLESNSRCANYVLARNLAFYLLRKHTDMTLEEIGQGFNRRHSTVIKGISALEKEVSKESHVGRQLSDFIRKVEKRCCEIKTF